jgi:hypothetical protein
MSEKQNIETQTENVFLTEDDTILCSVAEQNCCSVAETIDEPKNYYNKEKHKIYMQKYRAKKTNAYVKCQKEANNRYRLKMADYAKKYRDIMMNIDQLSIKVD